MAGRRTIQATLVTAVTIALGSGSALAHAGALGGSLQSTAVPSWLLVLTGGSVVGASFLFATLMTDHGAIRAINAVGTQLSRPRGLDWSPGACKRLVSSSCFCSS